MPARKLVSRAKLHPLPPAGRPNTVGLTSRELERVLDLLDATPPDHNMTQARVYSRWPFREQHIDVSIHHPGGSDVTLKLACRNLSKGGVAVLHNAFVYDDTRVTVRLPDAGGKLRQVPGTVARCEHLSGVVHQVGIRFDRELEPRDFVRPGPLDGLFTYERIAPQELCGTLCVLEPTTPDRNVIGQFLTDSHVRTIDARDIESAVAAAENGADAVLCAFKFEGGSAPELARAIRANDMPTPVIASGEPAAKGFREAILASPVDAFVPKPLLKHDLLRALAEYLYGGIGASAA
jgi:CheY-like chemotaxis protein